MYIRARIFPRSIKCLRARAKQTECTCGGRGSDKDSIERVPSRHSKWPSVPGLIYPDPRRPSRTHTHILHIREWIGRCTRDYTCKSQTASVRGQRYRGAGGGRQPFRTGRAASTPILIKRSHKRLTNWPYVRRFIGVPERDVKMFQS